MRRFILVNQEQPDQSIGEGVVWSDGKVSARWWDGQPFGDSYVAEVNDSVEDLLVELHYPDGTAKILWVDPEWDAPRPCTRSVAGGPPEPSIQDPSHRLLDGWSGPNGVQDRHGVPLHVGQRVKCDEPDETGDIGEITSFTVNEQGKLRVTLAGINCCNQADVDLADFEAIETTVQQTRERYDGRKPQWGWTPTITVPGTEQ